MLTLTLDAADLSLRSDRDKEKSAIVSNYFAVQDLGDPDSTNSRTSHTKYLVFGHRKHLAETNYTEESRSMRWARSAHEAG